MRTSLLTAEYFLKPCCGFISPSVRNTCIVKRKPLGGRVSTTASAHTSAINWPGDPREDLSGLSVALKIPLFPEKS